MVAPSEWAGDAAESVITKWARGEQVEIGQLYDVRTGTMFSGISLWRLADVKAKQEVQPCKDVTFDFCTNLKDLRKHHKLDAEGSMEIDFGIFELSGPAEYLKNDQRHEHEARVDVSCIAVKHKRYLPMELLTDMKFDHLLDDHRFTHVVAEVYEGGTGNITFRKKCSSAEEQTKISGALAGKLKSFVPISGKLSLSALFTRACLLFVSASFLIEKSRLRDREKILEDKNNYRSERERESERKKD